MGGKKLLKSEQEYFDYCISNDIGNIHRTYSSSYCDIDEDSSEKCNSYFSRFLRNELLHVTRKPKKYPCVFTWHCEEGDHNRYSGFFVYQDDFKEE